MDYPEISLGIVHNVWTRQMHFKKKGDHETQHTHAQQLQGWQAILDNFKRHVEAARSA